MMHDSDTLHCVYCLAEIDLASDWQMVSKREPAHTVCAWAVNDGVFAAQDTETSDKNAA